MNGSGRLAGLLEIDPDDLDTGTPEQPVPMPNRAPTTIEASASHAAEI